MLQTWWQLAAELCLIGSGLYILFLIFTGRLTIMGLRRRIKRSYGRSGQDQS